MKIATVFSALPALQTHITSDTIVRNINRSNKQGNADIAKRKLKEKEHRMSQLLKMYARSLNVLH
jgi:hypothetical protein